MREIKFRAFCQTCNKEVDADYIYMADGLTGLCPHHAFFSQCQLMQSTGLHDKNGKKIFEGDIVKTHEPNFDDEVLLEIVMFPAEHPDCIMGQTETNHAPLGDIADVCEIIGNIWENPELLKEQHHERG